MVGQPPFAITNTASDRHPALTHHRPVRPPRSRAKRRTTPASSAVRARRGANVERRPVEGPPPGWNVSGGYTETRGSSLDIVRAPNRDPDSMRIEGVQPFLWQTSEVSSVLHAGTFRLRRRPVKGIGSARRTRSPVAGQASSIGGGGTGRRPGRSEPRRRVGAFELRSAAPADRRHQHRTAVRAQPAVAERRRPLGRRARTGAARRRDLAVGHAVHARVLASASEAARGTNGTLRANYNGEAMQVSDPTIDQFFNTAAFRCRGRAPSATGEQHDRRPRQQAAERTVLA